MSLFFFFNIYSLSILSLSSSQIILKLDSAKFSTEQVYEKIHEFLKSKKDTIGNIRINK
jgi:hypothetical protein